MQLMRTNNNEANIKYETLAEKQNMWEKESRTKTERVKCYVETLILTYLIIKYYIF